MGVQHEALKNPDGLRPDRRAQEVSKQSVAFVVMLWTVELFALMFEDRKGVRSVLCPYFSHKAPH